MTTRRFLVPISMTVAALAAAPSQAAVPPANSEQISTQSDVANTLTGLVLDHATQPVMRMAQHQSHASHQSHQSHSSHVSGS